MVGRRREPVRWSRAQHAVLDRHLTPSERPLFDAVVRLGRRIPAATVTDVRDLATVLRFDAIVENLGGYSRVYELYTEVSRATEHEINTAPRPALLSELGWSPEQVVDTRQRFRTFEEDWDAPGMEVYDDM